jgi:hypothetical protein
MPETDATLIEELSFEVYTEFIELLESCPKFGKAVTRQSVLNTLPLYITNLPSPQGVDNRTHIRDIVTACWNYEHGIFVLLKRILFDEGDVKQAKKLDSFARRNFKVGKVFNYGLIKELEEMFFELEIEDGIVQKAFLEITADLVTGVPKVRSVEEIIYTLAELPEPAKLLKFVELVAQGVSSEWEESLRRWVDKALKLPEVKFDPAPYRQGGAAKAEDKPQKVYLSIRLSEAGPDGVKALAWLFRAKAGQHPENITPDPNRVYTKAEIPELLDSLVNKAAQYGKPVIEFFLPRNWLCVAVEAWESAELGEPIGLHYPVVVRAQERLQKTMPDWKARWNLLQGAGCHALQWVSEPEEARFDRLAYKLRTEWEQLAGVGLSIPPAQIADPKEPKDTIKALLNYGLPVALWPRPALADFTPQQIKEFLEKALSGKQLVDLPEIIYKLRCWAEPKPSETTIGGAVTILWDDPERPDPLGQLALSAPF